MRASVLISIGNCDLYLIKENFSPIKLVKFTRRVFLVCRLCLVDMTTGCWRATGLDMMNNIWPGPGGRVTR